MSRGFVKEDDLEHAGTDLPERPVSPHPNYVTPIGLKQLEDAANALDKERVSLLGDKENETAKQRLAVIDRDLRYLSVRLKDAILVEPTNQDRSTVLFGAIVKVEDEAGELLEFHVVGEDEADIAQHKVSYVSPIAKALIGRKVGDSVRWKRPAGILELEIIEINY
ncbi:MAG: GreA/GreB family elongation factor [Methylophilaceae bacterium]|jgi:transcription elongation GreA/GreB family factor|nr:GreA/GreB family elongation factor [Methylophilaceae bacterium]MDG1453820.1 GreA/GreB family elongation factor [Methylophilaceae bacterium]